MKEKLSCSELTKIKIGEALKEIMITTPFEKITVSNITDKCKIHRQTFYYHFQDRYELLDWVLYRELIMPLITDFNKDNMFSKFYNTFDTIYNNKKFYQNAFKINTADLSKYISTVATEEFSKVIKEIGKRNGIATNSIDDEFIAEFFGCGMSGVVLNWVNKNMKETPKQMTTRVETLVNACRIVAVNL